MKYKRIVTVFELRAPLFVIYSRSVYAVDI